jgi:hypothetical protein
LFLLWNPSRQTGEISLRLVKSLGGEIPLRRVRGRILFHRMRSIRFHRRHSPMISPCAERTISLCCLCTPRSGAAVSRGFPFPSTVNYPFPQMSTD